MTSRVLAFAGVVSLAVVSFTSQPLAQTTGTFDQGAVRPGNGVTPPSLISQVQPKYTSDALKRKVQGDVELEAVVSRDGTVSEVRLVKGLDPGLDAEAVKAARQWSFRPGSDRDGNVVPVIVTLILSFRAKSGVTPEVQQAADDEFTKGACRVPATGNTAPRLVHPVEPKYTSDAMRARIEGTVTMEAVVDPDGTVARARVVKSLDTLFGLDAEAVNAASQWTFEPDSGKCQGLPAPVVVTFVLSFRLH